MQSKGFLTLTLKYATIFVAFLSLNSLAPGAPAAAALYIALLYASEPVFICAILFALSFGVFANLEMLFVGAVQAVLLGAIFCLYRSKNKKPKVEFIFYYFISLCPYFFLFNQVDIIKKLVYTAVICLFSFFAASAVSTAKYKGIKAVPSVKEVAECSALFIAIATGAVALFGISAYKLATTFLLLFSIKIFKDSKSAVVCGIFAAAPAIFFQQPHWFAIFFMYFAAAKLFIEPISLFGALALIAAEAISAFVFKLYGSYGYYELLFTALPALIFSFIPNRFFDAIAEKSYAKSGDILTRNAININRTKLSARLYDVSAVFFQMRDSFLSLSDVDGYDAALQKITDEIMLNACQNCVLNERCGKNSSLKRETVSKVVTLAAAKGRITLIDLPREFTEQCSYPNSLIFEINRLIGLYVEHLKKGQGENESKEIVSLSAGGLGKILKCLAFELSKTLSSDKKAERHIAKTLALFGIKTGGVMVLGEGADAEITVICEKAQAESKKLLKAIETATAKRLSLVEKTPVLNGSFALTFKISPTFDAAFGVSAKTKKGSDACGDKHSLIKISQSKFLVALSDGMGSGKNAELTSSAALELIESFYRAGLDSELILSTVNKVLAISLDDNFSALDLGIVDLFSGNADFIKIGSPYGFILNSEGIRFIEGSSLPLGILEELRPTSAQAAVTDGDIIIMLSDGVTDAFGSSGDILDYLKGAPCKNPQLLADSIINKAIELSSDIGDDMTAICVRIFKRAS